jgi:hypothetical protein
LHLRGSPEVAQALPIAGECDCGGGYEALADKEVDRIE